MKCEQGQSYIICDAYTAHTDLDLFFNTKGSCQSRLITLFYIQNYVMGFQGFSVIQSNDCEYSISNFCKKQKF